MKKILTLLTFISVLISISDMTRAQSILYVKAGATGTNNGSSWTNAYTDLQSALTAATSGDQIWVATGTYKPSAYPADCTGCISPRDYTFHLKDGIELYGGFAGTESMLTQRDIASNETILSGDIGAVGDISDNVYHVVVAFFANTTPTTRLDGFTITGGYANGVRPISVNTVLVYSWDGGGIWIGGGTNMITNNILKGNWAYSSGGGIYIVYGTNTITNNSLSGNWASSGGGIYNFGGTNTFTNNNISGNSASAGGGIYTNQSINIITNNSIAGNSAFNGGGICCVNSLINITNNIIWSNSSGVFNAGSSLTITYSIIQDGFTGTGNLDADPLFADPLNGDLRLTGCSPAINAGSVAAIPIGITTDLDGNPRLFGSAVDMGAYEYQGIVYPPTISCPTIPPTVSLGANCSTTLPDYTLFANANSICGVQSITQLPAPGSPISGVGSMTVTLTVISNNSLTSQCSFLINKVDNTLPAIICPPNQTVTLGPNCTGQLLDYRSLAQASDNCNIQNVFQVPSAFTTVSGAGFLNVTITAVDVSGNQNQCSFSVTKVDISPPTINCPSTQTINLNINCAATIPNYTGFATAGDNCGVQSITQMPAAGSAVSGAGDMTVSLRVTDVNGWTNSCSFIVAKTDNTPPSVECFNQPISFNGETNILLDPNDLVEASDNCGVQNISLSPNSVNSSQVGQTVPVLVTVTDINGISSTCTSLISVGGLPAGWSQNINGVGCANGNEIEYNSSTEVWTATSTNCFYSSPFTSDATAFAQMTLCGDGSITAHVTGISGTSPGWAGVVMRESNAGGAKKAQLTTNMAGNQSRREFRSTTNGSAMPQNFAAQNRFWLRVVRTGNQFMMYNSPDGAQWYLTGAQTIAMNSCIQIGLVSTNYNSSSTVTTTFANVSFTGSVQIQTTPLPGSGYFSANEAYQPDFIVYPNPTSDILNIDLKEYIGKNVQIELYSMGGKLMKMIQLDEVRDHTQTMQLDGFADGLYFVKLRSEGLPDATKRVVLAKN